MRNVGHFVFISMSGKNSRVAALGLLRSVLRNQQPNTVSESGRAPVFMSTGCYFVNAGGLYGTCPYGWPRDILRHLCDKCEFGWTAFTLCIYIYNKFTFYLWNNCLIIAVTPSSALMRPRSRYIEAITKWTPSLTRYFQIHLLELNVMCSD